jgi:hypothetical protein
MPAILSGQGRAASAEIEITAYALLALLTKDKNVAISDIMPIVRWLTNQRNAYGGFASTQVCLFRRHHPIADYCFTDLSMWIMDFISFQ